MKNKKIKKNKNPKNSANREQIIKDLEALADQHPLTAPIVKLYIGDTLIPITGFLHKTWSSDPTFALYKKSHTRSRVRIFFPAFIVKKVKGNNILIDKVNEYIIQTDPPTEWGKW